MEPSEELVRLMKARFSQTDTSESSSRRARYEAETMSSFDRQGLGECLHPKHSKLEEEVKQAREAQSQDNLIEQNADHYFSVGSELCERGEHGRGRAALNQALQLHSSMKEPPQIKIAQDLESIAKALLALGEVDHAEQAITRSLRILDKLESRSTPSSLKNPVPGATSLDSLQVVKKRSRVEREQETLRIRIQEACERHSDATQAMEKGDYETAVALLHNVLEVRSDALGGTTYEVGETLQQLSACYKHLGELDKASKYASRALEVFTSGDSGAHQCAETNNETAREKSEWGDLGQMVKKKSRIEIEKEAARAKKSAGQSDQSDAVALSRPVAQTTAAFGEGFVRKMSKLEREKLAAKKACSTPAEDGDKENKENVSDVNRKDAKQSTLGFEGGLGEICKKRYSRLEMMQQEAKTRAEGEKTTRRTSIAQSPLQPRRGRDKSATSSSFGGGLGENVVRKKSRLQLEQEAMRKAMAAESNSQARQF